MEPCRQSDSNDLPSRIFHPSNPSPISSPKQTLPNTHPQNPSRLPSVPPSENRRTYHQATMQLAMAVASLALRRLAAAAASSQALAAASIRCPVAAAPSLFVAQPPAVGAAAIDFRRGYAARGGARKAKAVSEDDEEFDENDAEPFDSDVMEDFDDDDMEGFDEEEGDFDEEEELEMKGGRGKR